MKSFYPAWGWALLILTLCAIPGNRIPSPGFEMRIDLYVHFGLYLILAFLVYRGWHKNRRKRMPVGTLLAFVALFIGYGVAIEYCQHYLFQNRFFDEYDIIANIIGSGTGMFLSHIYFQD